MSVLLAFFVFFLYSFDNFIVYIFEAMIRWMNDDILYSLGTNPKCVNIGGSADRTRTRQWVYIVGLILSTRLSVVSSIVAADLFKWLTPLFTYFGTNLKHRSFLNFNPSIDALFFGLRSARRTPLFRRDRFVIFVLWKIFSFYFASISRFYGNA